jgi:hypothetical protein
MKKTFSFHVLILWKGIFYTWSVPVYVYKYSAFYIKQLKEVYNHSL